MFRISSKPNRNGSQVTQNVARFAAPATCTMHGQPAHQAALKLLKEFLDQQCAEHERGVRAELSRPSVSVRSSDLLLKNEVYRVVF